MPSPRSIFVTTAVTAVTLVALPATARALEPTVAAEVVLGGQDVPSSMMFAAQPRLVLRLDRHAPLSAYARLGADFTLIDEAPQADGFAFEAAGGVDGRTCRAGTGWCVGVRAGLGLQVAAYDDLDEEPDVDRGYESLTAFAELHPYASWGRVSLGIEARAHAGLRTVEIDNITGDGREVDESKPRFALGLSLALRF